MRHFIPKQGQAGFTTNQRGYRWKGTVYVASRLLPGSQNIHFTLNHIFRRFSETWQRQTDGHTLVCVAGGTEIATNFQTIVTATKLSEI